MNSKSKIITMALSSVLAITMITHYVITQIPDETKSNIDIPVDVNAFDAFTGITPLMQAGIDSDYERAKLLLAQGADLNLRSANSDRDYAINYALINGGKMGSVAVAQLLIGAGADVNVKNARGMAPIHMMMFITQADSRAQILRELMNNNADINAQNEDGSTMLHITVTMNDWDWIRHLNTNYGQIINYNLRDNKGRTALDLAVELGHVSLNDADSIENELRKRPIYIGDNYDVKATDKEGRTGLQLAILRSDMKFVEGLVTHGAQLGHQDNSGKTALHYAVLNQNPIPFVQYLLAAHAPTNIADNQGDSPLMLVMHIRDLQKRHEVAKMLLEAGSPITHKNTAGKTIIDLAHAAGDNGLGNLIRAELEKRQGLQKG